MKLKSKSKIKFTNGASICVYGTKKLTVLERFTRTTITIQSCTFKASGYQNHRNTTTLITIVYIKIIAMHVVFLFFQSQWCTRGVLSERDRVIRFWRMSLPIGNTQDHPYANPFGPQSPSLESIKLDPILLIAGGDEIMKDRVELYAKKLKELGKMAQYVEFKGKQHGFFTNEPYSDVSDSVLNLIRDFMFKHAS